MPNYRRAFVPGGCWFFTVNLLDRRQTLLVDHIEALRAAVAATRQTFPFDIDAMIILPDHMHAVLSLPLEDADFSTRWRLIKSRFAKAHPKQERRSAVRAARGERGIWQRRFWEHLIRDDADTRVMWSIATSIRSSTGLCAASGIGRIRLFIAMWSAEYSPSIGRATWMPRASSASRGRRAQ
jgi:REP element-mobilizing transposase RayT